MVSEPFLCLTHNKARSFASSFFFAQRKKRNIAILRQQKDWVGGVEKRQFLLTLSTVIMLTVGGSEKVQKYADVIKGWSLSEYESSSGHSFCLILMVG